MLHEIFDLLDLLNAIALWRYWAFVAPTLISGVIVGIYGASFIGSIGTNILTAIIIIAGQFFGIRAELKKGRLVKSKKLPSK